jgi:hypothetical protein
MKLFVFIQSAGKKYYKAGGYSSPNVKYFTRSLTGADKKYIDDRLNSEGEGEVVERLMAPLSKSGILSKNGIVGSNPTLSAKDLGLNDDPPV